MSDDGSGARVGIPAALVTDLNAQVMLECLWWYMAVSPLAPKGERPEEAVFVRLAHDDVLAIEDGELMDLGPAPSAPERPPSMLDRVLGGLAELLGGGAQPTQEQLDRALDSLAAAQEFDEEEEEEDEEEESDSDGEMSDGDGSDGEESGTDDEYDELEWEEEGEQDDEEEDEDWTAADIRTERQITE